MRDNAAVDPAIATADMERPKRPGGTDYDPASAFPVFGRKRMG